MPDEVGVDTGKTKTIAGIVLAAILGVGGTYAITDNQINELQAKVDDLQTTKVAILSQYIYAEARLNETPTFDFSTASVDEMSQAYIKAVQDKQIVNPPDNLFTALRDKAVELTEACTP